MTAAVADPVFDALGLSQGVASTGVRGSPNSQWHPTFSNSWHGSATSTTGASTTKVPTLGSAGHKAGTCKPCAFVHTKGCNSGDKCQFCHLCEPGALKRRKKDQLETRRKGQGRSRPDVPYNSPPVGLAPSATVEPGLLPAPYPVSPGAVFPGFPLWVPMPPMPPGLGCPYPPLNPTSAAHALHPLLQPGPPPPPGNFHVMPQTPPPKSSPILSTSPLKRTHPRSKSADFKQAMNKDVCNDASAIEWFETLLARSADKRASPTPVLKLSDMVHGAPDTPGAAWRMCMRSAGASASKATTSADSGALLLKLVKGGKQKQSTRKPLTDGVQQGAALLRRLHGGSDTPSTVSSDGDNAPADIGRTLLKQLHGVHMRR